MLNSHLPHKAHYHSEQQWWLSSTTLTECVARPLPSPHLSHIEDHKLHLVLSEAQFNVFPAIRWIIHSSSLACHNLSISLSLSLSRTLWIFYFLFFFWGWSLSCYQTFKPSCSCYRDSRPWDLQPTARWLPVQTITDLLWRFSQLLWQQAISSAMQQVRWVRFSVHSFRERLWVQWYTNTQWCMSSHKFKILSFRSWATHNVLYDTFNVRVINSIVNLFIHYILDTLIWQ